MDIVAAIVFILPVHDFIRRSVQISESEKDEELDERQQIVRDRAYRSAYWILGITCLYTFLYISYVHPWLAERWEWLQFDSLPILMTMGAALVVFTIPRAVMAWTEPEFED